LLLRTLTIYKMSFDKVFRDKYLKSEEEVGNRLREISGKETFSPTLVPGQQDQFWLKRDSRGFDFSSWFVPPEENGPQVIVTGKQHPQSLNLNFEALGFDTEEENYLIHAPTCRFSLGGIEKRYYTSFSVSLCCVKVRKNTFKQLPVGKKQTIKDIVPGKKESCESVPDSPPKKIQLDDSVSGSDHLQVVSEQRNQRNLEVDFLVPVENKTLVEDTFVRYCCSCNSVTEDFSCSQRKKKIPKCRLCLVQERKLFILSKIPLLSSQAQESVVDGRLDFDLLFESYVLQEGVTGIKGSNHVLVINNTDLVPCCDTAARRRCKREEREKRKKYLLRLRKERNKSKKLCIDCGSLKQKNRHSRCNDCISEDIKRSRTPYFSPAISLETRLQKYYVPSLSWTTVGQNSSPRDEALAFEEEQFYRIASRSLFREKNFFERPKEFAFAEIQLVFSLLGLLPDLQNLLFKYCSYLVDYYKTNEYRTDLKSRLPFSDYVEITENQSIHPKLRDHLSTAESFNLARGSTIGDYPIHIFTYANDSYRISQGDVPTYLPVYFAIRKCDNGISARLTHTIPSVMLNVNNVGFFY